MNGEKHKAAEHADISVTNQSKRPWQAPHLVALSINKTNSGTWNNDTEGGIWIFTWGPPQS